MTTSECAARELAAVAHRPRGVPSVLEAAQKRLQGSPYPAVRRVGCTYQHGTLRLQGRLHCYFHKQLAQEAVAHLDGVIHLVNEIEVREVGHVGSHPAKG
jgi:hypothetical protein